MKEPTIAIVDPLGLPYDGNTLAQRGLGGSESWTILFSQELHKLGFRVTVYNACDEEGCAPGTYNGVEYKPLHSISTHSDTYDILIVSRTVHPYLNQESDPRTPGYNRLIQHAQWKMLWMHDTFLEGDEHLERLLVTGVIDEAVTLSDWHANYIMTCNHGHKRNYEVLKNHIYVSRNGINKYNTDVDIAKKDPNLFVYNASVSKGMTVLLKDCWPEIKKRIPDAVLHIVGGFYRFRESHGPDEQEKKWIALRDQYHGKNGVHFTGVIKQSEIAELLTKATYFLYPTEFPETFGISTLEAQAYNCVPITTRFGALEEVAIDLCSWKLDYSVTPNSVFPNINQSEQVKKFVNLVCYAYNNKYLTQQKQYYCNNVKDICGWDSVALQFKQHIYATLDWYMPIHETREVKYINNRVHEVFGRRMSNAVEWGDYHVPEKEIVVISPFWNAESYISDNIHSVASQDYHNYRHILINDCSEDNSFTVAKQTIESLGDLGNKFTLINNSKNVGAVFNQIMTIREYVDNPDAIVILLDGDDKLKANPNVFKYINMLHNRGSEFTYGSCWSMVDNIPLITQPYPEQVKKSKSYRTHRFTWGIPYTHLRTFRKSLLNKVDDAVFKDSDGNWFRAGGDVAIFYNLIEAADPNCVTAVSDILCMYNDANPLNDYKINAAEQTHTAALAKGTSTMIPTKAYILRIPNSPRSVEYAKTAAESCDRVGLTWEYFDGVEGKHPDEIWGKDNELGITNYFRDMHTAAANCTHGHFLIWKKIADNNECAIILEHDALMLHPINIPILDHTINVLGYKLRDITRYDYQAAGVTKHFVPIQTHRGAHAYALTANTARELLKELQEEGVEVCVDTKYFRRLDKKYISKIPMVLADPISSLGWVRHSTIVNFTPPDVTDLDYIDSFTQYLDKKMTTKTILVAVPAAKYIESETFKSIANLTVPQGYRVDFQYFLGNNIEQQRNAISTYTLKHGYDYLFSVDSDIVLPQDTLVKMLAHDKDMISGVYIQRIPNTHVVELYRVTPGNGRGHIPYELLKDRGLVEIAGCGFGCVLIKRKVLENVPTPHFVYHEALDHQHTVSEDVHFCVQATNQGFTIWTDTSILCDHVGQTTYTP